MQREANNITSVKYIRDDKGNDSVVLIVYGGDSSKTTVQVDNVGNLDWDNVVEWVAAGNTITAHDG